jgi:hypothetical protein
MVNERVRGRMTLADTILMPKKAPPVENLINWDITYDKNGNAHVNGPKFYIAQSTFAEHPHKSFA